MPPHGPAHVGKCVLIADEDFGAGLSQTPCAMVVAPDKGANRKALFEQLESGR